MEKLIKFLEKLTPKFEKISRNKYMSSIRNGFMESMPVVIFSSIFLLIAYLPNVFNFYWSPETEAFIMKPYNYSMGFLGAIVAITTAKHFTTQLNRKMPIDNQINSLSVMFCAFVGFMILSVDGLEGGYKAEFLGSKGLITAFIAAFVAGNIYKFSISKNLTLKMPKEVPPNISQAFKDIIPFAIATMVFWGIDIAARYVADVNLAETIIKVIQPLFSAADSYLGTALIYGAMAFFWFIGIHGPSVVNPAITALAFINRDANIAAFRAGQHATAIVTPNTGEFIATLGGTGATFIVPILFLIFAKSKQNKAVGKASAIPTMFGVNEPILFGGPLILNPIFMIPFILAPVINVWIFKFFVEVLGMNSMIAQLPWTTPGPIGTIISTGFAPLSFLLAPLLLLVDGLIYYPFFKVYDRQIQKQEQMNLEAEQLEEKQEQNYDLEEIKKSNKEISVLVLCAGGGTSGLLANALNKGAKEQGINIIAAAGSYGSHYDILPKFDMVILAPQVASNYEEIKVDTDRIGNKLVKTEGKEYIELTKNSEKAINLVLNSVGRK